MKQQNRASGDNGVCRMKAFVLANTARYGYFNNEASCDSSTSHMHTRERFPSDAYSRSPLILIEKWDVIPNGIQIVLVLNMAVALLFG